MCGLDTDLSRFLEMLTILRGQSEGSPNLTGPVLCIVVLLFSFLHRSFPHFLLCLITSHGEASKSDLSSTDVTNSHLFESDDISLD